MAPDETKNVYRLYDKIADWFDETRTRQLIEKQYLEFFGRYLKSGAPVLDLGCGTGEPILRFLAEQKFEVTGVDASDGMLAIAKERFPETRFINCDMRALELDERFDGIVAWHSFFHLAFDDQRKMFEIFARHMNSGGILIFTSGPKHGEAWGENNGEMLYHASLDADEYRALLKAHHFDVLQHVVEDAECGGATVWVARYIPT